MIDAITKIWPSSGDMKGRNSEGSVRKNRRSDVYSSALDNCLRVRQARCSSLAPPRQANKALRGTSGDPARGTSEAWAPPHTRCKRRRPISAAATKNRRSREKATRTSTRIEVAIKRRRRSRIFATPMTTYEEAHQKSRCVTTQSVCRRANPKAGPRLEPQITLTVIVKIK